MRFGWILMLLLAASAARAQGPEPCFYSDWLSEPRPAPCPEAARYPDQLPPPPRGTLWLPAANLPHVYKAERILRRGPNGFEYDGPLPDGASLPAIRIQTDGRIAPERFPDGPREDGGREVPAPRPPGGRYCTYLVLMERDASGQYYGETSGSCPEDHASLGLGTPPPGRMWARVDKNGAMRLARFVVPSSAVGPPEAPPGPVPLLRAAPEPAPAPQAAPLAEARPAAAPAPAQPRDAPGPQPPAAGAAALAALGLALLLALGAAAYFFGRSRPSPSSRAPFAGSWTRPGAPGIQSMPSILELPRPEASPPFSGLLRGRYEFKGKIGEGGMGIVLEAFDHSLGRRVAIKVMRAEIARADGARDAFLTEARIISHMSHPYIVAIHEVIEDAGGVYLVFDFVDGEPLSAVLKRRGRLPLDECVRVFTYVCEAIACAHRSRVLHRDLKPSNIMIDAGGYAKVMDFGIAREAKETVTRLTSLDISGTPAYMAPEQHLGRCAKTSDIYALGVCLYEAMTGALPFSGPDFLAQKERMKYAPPQFLAPGLPKEVELLFAATLSPDPKLRVADAAELVDSLKSLLA